MKKIIYVALSTIAAIDMLSNKAWEIVAQLQGHYALAQLCATREITDALLFMLFMALADRAPRR